MNALCGMVMLLYIIDRVTTMIEVQAIRTDSDILKVQEFLIKHYGIDYHDMFILGMNMALRIGDLLAITTADASKALRAGQMIVLEKKTAFKVKHKGTPAEERTRTKVKARVINLNNLSMSILKTRIMENQTDTW